MESKIKIIKQVPMKSTKFLYHDWLSKLFIKKIVILIIMQCSIFCQAKKCYFSFLSSQNSFSIKL